MNFKNKAVYINWITAFIWSWYLLCIWTNFPIPSFIITNAAIVTFIILCFQILAHCDLQNIIRLKDKEINFIIIISIITVICLIFSRSGFGAFFTILNLCLLWYLSDKWVWNRGQIIFMGAIFFSLYISWLYNPMQLGTTINGNTIGTITTFSMFTLITCIRYTAPSKKWVCIFEIILIGLSLHQLLIFHGRGTLIAVIFYVLLRFLSFTPFWRNNYLYKISCYLLTLGSLVFVFIYTKIGLIAGVNFVVPFWDKWVFSGRERIWSELWNYFKLHPFVGTGTNVTLQSWPEYNVHNAIYSILITHGIVVFILVMEYMIKKMIKLFSKYKDYTVFAPAICGIFAVFMESFFDMDLLWFPQFLVWSFMLIILASSAPSPASTSSKGE